MEKLPRCRGTPSERLCPGANHSHLSTCRTHTHACSSFPRRTLCNLQISLRSLCERLRLWLRARAASRHVAESLRKAWQHPCRHRVCACYQETEGMEMGSAAPIVLLIHPKFCWCEVKEGKCGLELWKRSLEKEYGGSWGAEWWQRRRV